MGILCKTELEQHLADSGAEAAQKFWAQIAALEGRIAELEREVTAITRQRDETYALLQEAREKIQRITFGSAKLRASQGKGEVP